MLGKIAGMFIGRSIDRMDGKGGVKGAVLGLAAERFLRRLGPVGWILMGLAWLVARLLFGRRRVRRY